VERQRLAVLSDVLRVRLRNKLREELGATYGVGVNMKTYHLPQEHYRVGFQFDAAPERIDELIDVFTAELDSVRTQGVTSAELARVATVHKRRFETRLQQNRYWLSTIHLYDRLGIPLDQIVVPSDPSAVTPVVIRDAAERYLPRDSYLQMTYLPKDSTSGSPSDTTAKR
jgi:Predicted Zn-dependent peptidases